MTWTIASSAPYSRMHGRLNATIAAGATAAASNTVPQLPGPACALIDSVRYDSDTLYSALPGKTERGNFVATDLDDGNFYNCSIAFCITRLICVALATRPSPDPDEKRMRSLPCPSQRLYSNQHQKARNQKCLYFPAYALCAPIWPVQ